MKILALIGVALGLAVTAGAQTTPIKQPDPCSAAGYHQFDFWLGDWNVTDASGTQQGVNKIIREEKGCLLVERWTSAAGNTGQSYNYYNPVSDKWRQVWVSQGAIIDYEGGLTETGSMKLVGTISPQAGGEAAPFTGEWTLNEDGSVTQHFEQYNAEDDEWAVWFTGIYRRIESDQL